MHIFNVSQFPQVKNAERLNFGAVIYFLQTFPLKCSEVILRLNVKRVILHMCFIKAYQYPQLKEHNFLSVYILFMLVLLGSVCPFFFSLGYTSVIKTKRTGKQHVAYFNAVCKYNKKIYPGISLAVQWLRIHLPMQGTWVRFLVGELRSHMPWGN